MSDQISADAENKVVESPDGENNGSEQSEVSTEIETLKAELAKNQELIKKLRKFEKENLTRAEQEAKAKEEALKEQGKYKELYEELTGKMRSQKVDSAIEAALVESKAKSNKTVKALIDKSQIEFDGEEVNANSLKNLIAGLKKEHSVLFDVETAASVKRAGEAENISGYEKEVRGAKTTAELQKILRKYGKL